MKKLLPLFALLLLFAACRHEGQSAEVLDQERMTAFLCDAYLLEGYNAVETHYRFDSVSVESLRGYDSILDLHGLTREQVEQSLDYYTAHLDLYQAINDSVVARLERYPIE